MAKVLKKFEFRTKGNYAQYPWDKWGDGRIWKLVAGEDFTATPKSVRTAAYSVASRMGKKVRVNIVDEGQALILQFYTPGE